MASLIKESQAFVWHRHFCLLYNRHHSGCVCVCVCVCVGWEEGAGLGLREQGIQEPIRGGEVRDKNDKYKVTMLHNSLLRYLSHIHIYVYPPPPLPSTWHALYMQGVGMDMRDPFEQFRKNKSYTFSKTRGPPPPACECLYYKTTPVI